MADHYYITTLNKVKDFAKPPSHHEVSDEIQNHLLKAAYGTFLGLVGCLSWNTLAVTILWKQGGVDTKMLLLASAYLVFGVPAAYMSWFRPLSLAFRTENTELFRSFFLFSLVHIGFCIFASVSPPPVSSGRSLTGFFTALDMFFHGPGLVGIPYFIGSILFAVEAAVSIWVLKRVNAYYNQTGLALEMIRVFNVSLLNNKV